MTGTSVVHRQRGSGGALPLASVGSDKFIDRDYRLSIVIGLSIDKRSISIIIIDKSGSQLLSEPYYMNISLSSLIIN